MRRREPVIKGRRALMVALLLSLLIGKAAQAATPPIRHVFVVVGENESASMTFGAGSPAPYLSQTLVARGAYLSNYYAIGHSSLDNYIAMVSGQAPNPLTSGDCTSFVNFPADSLSSGGQENGEGCVYPADVPTLMSQMDVAGLSWRAYEDGMGAEPSRESATCGHPTVGTSDQTQRATPGDQYATRHDPFVYFHYVIDNQAECNANVVNLDQLPGALQSAATTPNYVFITPNLCNDGHDATCANGGPGGLAQADSFLQTWVPRITGSPAFQQNGLLIITFDEAVSDSSACCGETPGPSEPLPGGNGPGGGVVGAVLLSPFIAPGVKLSTSYNHYSMLASIEEIFGLTRIGEARSANTFGADVYQQPSAATPTTAPSPAGQPTSPATAPVAASRVLALLAGAIVPSGKPARIAMLLGRHGYLVRLKAPEAGRALVQWFKVPAGAKLAKAKPRPTLVAYGQAVYKAAGTKTFRLTLTAAGKRLLSHTKRIKLVAKGTFTPTGGKPLSVVKSFTLKR